jgi:shikimate kinase
MLKFSRIYLTGFMTSGKSTIGPILANVLGWDFCDLDKIIEADYKKTIVQIFEQIGESEFRKVESEYLKKISEQNNIVISLGGGTICNDVNLQFIKETGKLIFLAVSIETLRRRLKKKLDRPLFRDLVLEDRPDEEFDERIINLLKKREPYYNKADITIQSDNFKVGITVDLLAEKLERLLNE